MGSTGETWSLGLMAAAAFANGTARAAVASAGDDLTTLTITEASRRIAARELTSIDLTRAYLARIEQLNPGINAYITVTGEQALAQARALDAETAAGRSRDALARAHAGKWLNDSGSKIPAD